MNTPAEALKAILGIPFRFDPSHITRSIETQIGRRMKEIESRYHTPAHNPRPHYYDPKDPPRPIKSWGFDELNRAKTASRDERRAQLAGLVAQNYTTVDIAAAFGLTVDPILRDLRALGIKARQPVDPKIRRGQERIEKVRELWDCPDKMIANVLGVHQRTVREYRRRIRAMDGTS